MSTPQILSGGLGLLGLGSQAKSNQQADREAQQQLAMQQQLIDAQIGARNNYLDAVGRLGEQGAFNPAQQTFDALHAGQQGLTSALNSEAGAARALGYGPGDTVPLDEMNRTTGNFQLQQAGLQNQIAQQSRANYLAALQGAPSLSELNAGIGATGENARMFYGQSQPMGGLLGALGQQLGSLIPGQSAPAPAQATVGIGAPPGPFGVNNDVLGAYGQYFPSAPRAPRPRVAQSVFNL